MSFLETIAIKGKIGDNNYYLTKLKANQLTGLVKPACELEEWDELSLEEKFQRDPNYKRVKQEIAPYLACNKDRFYGSIIVVALNGGVEFESIKDFKISEVPKRYQRQSDDMGFLTFAGGSYVVLDGQHRLLGLRQVVQGAEGGEGPYQRDVPEDDVSVIVIEQESESKTRSIFTVLNRYAKPTSAGQNVAMDEKDACAILSRKLLNEKIVNVEKVNTKGSALPDSTAYFTSLIALYQMNEAIMKHKTTLVQKNKAIEIDGTEIEEAWLVLQEYWTTVMEKLNAFRLGNDLNERTQDLRDVNGEHSLLMKPVAQEALIDALMYSTEDGVLTIDNAIDRANKLPWSYNHEIWKHVLIAGDGKIQSGKAARKRAASLITYLIAGDKLSDEKKELHLENYQLSFAKKVNEDKSKWKDFPDRKKFL